MRTQASMNASLIKFQNQKSSREETQRLEACHNPSLEQRVTDCSSRTNENLSQLPEVANIW